MGLLNFIDTGFIIILAILLLITGGIMFYCYRRLNLLEESIINQGKILQNLISNLQNYNKDEESNIDDKNINNENINIFNKYKDNSYTKVQVSDNDSSDDDSYCETNSEDEIDIDHINNKNEEYLENNIEHNIKNIIDIDEDIDEDIDDEGDIDDIKQQDVDKENTELLEKSLIDISMKVKENEENNLKVLEISDDIINNISDQDFINNNIKQNNDNKKNEIKNRNFTKMKVDELKQLVFDKNLNSDEIDYEEINSMKKNDLIKLLTK